MVTKRKTQKTLKTRKTTPKKQIRRREYYPDNPTYYLDIPKDYHKTDRTHIVPWTDKDLLKITRLRLISDPGYPYWDVSYCHGVMKDGKNVSVELPFNQLPKHDMRGAILAYAKQDHVYAKQLGIFSAISTWQ